MSVHRREDIKRRTPIMYCIGTNFVHCHTCPANFPPPKREDGYNDASGECPGCKKKYIFFWKRDT